MITASCPIRTIGHRSTIPNLIIPTAHLRGPGKLNLENQRLRFANDGGTQLYLDPKYLENILLYGNVQVSTQAILLLSQNSVNLNLLSHTGHRHHATLATNNAGYVKRRGQQHMASNNPQFQLSFARSLIRAKIAAQLNAWRHFQRQGLATSNQMQNVAFDMIDQLDTVTNLNALRGIEGNCAREWFAFFRSLLPAPWTFARRQRKPTVDPINSLLNLGYTLLANQMIAQIQAQGLEANLGTLHSFRAGRMSLACDLIEPLRVPSVDRWVLRLCREHRITRDCFNLNDGQIHLTGSAFQLALCFWEQHQTHTRLQQQCDKQLAGYLEALDENSNCDNHRDVASSNELAADVRTVDHPLESHAIKKIDINIFP